MTVDLKTFAQARSKRTRTCAVCVLDPGIRGEVNGAIKDGIGNRIIGHWLQDEQGLDVNERAVKYHRESRHHLEDM